MATPLTYTSLQTELLSIIARVPAPYTTPDAAFVVQYPQAISYAENRIYHDIPFLAQRAQDTSLSTTAGSRSLSLYGTQLPILVPERIAIMNGDTMIQALPTSLDFIDMWWPDETETSDPLPGVYYKLFWAILGGYSSQDFISPTIVLAPTLKASYPVVVTGLFQQPPLSGNNPQTYISTVYPELMLSACMVFLSGALLRNYAASGIPGTQQPDEPGQPVYWEAQYNTLLRIAQDQEVRSRAQGTHVFDGLPAPPPGNPAPPRPPGR